MPLPFIIGGIGLLAGAVGVGAGINGISKMKGAKDTLESAKDRHDRNRKKLENENVLTAGSMDDLGKLELKILQSFEKFSDLYEKIKNKPRFAEIFTADFELPKFNMEELKDVSIGAGVLLGGLSGAGLGAAGGFAASGATTAAVMALGTASTGTAISSLSGVAATNATLAALGGGSLAVGGGGIALGSAVLGTATLGVGLLVGGIIFNFTGSSLSEKADDAWEEMLEVEKKINSICKFLIDLREVSKNYYKTLDGVSKKYEKNLRKLEEMVKDLKHTDAAFFTEEEMLILKNTVLLVGLLYEMCKVKIVLKAEEETEPNRMNSEEIQQMEEKVEKVVGNIVEVEL